MTPPPIAGGDLARLLAIEDIRLLKARYFRCLDTKDWDGLAAVFTDDAEFDLRAVNSVRHPLTGDWSPPLAGDAAIHHGRTAVVAMIRRSVERRITVHHGHMGEIAMTGEATGTGIWAMEDRLRAAPGEPAWRLHGFGHYHDQYRRDAGGWAINRTRITRLMLDRG